MMSLKNFKKNTYRVATVGCGRMGASVRPSVEKWAPLHLRDTSHLSSIRALGIASKLAAADVSFKSLHAAEKEFSLDAIYSDYKEMLRSFSPEILTIATRTPLKSDILSMAIEQGIKAIHVEKPLCNSEVDRQLLSKLFSKEDVFISSGCLRRYALPFQEARDWFNNDGVAQDISFSMGRSPLAWTQFHAIDLALFFAGTRNVSYVQATLHDTIWEGQTVMNDPIVVSLTIGFEDGLVAHIGQGCGAKVSLSKANEQLDIFSDGHQIFHATQQDTESPYLRKNIKLINNGELSGTQSPIAMLVGTLQDDVLCKYELKKNMVDFLLTQQICFAALLSDRLNGKRVSLNEVTEDLVFLAKTGDLYA